MVGTSLLERDFARAQGWSIYLTSRSFNRLVPLYSLNFLVNPSPKDLGAQLIMSNTPVVTKKQLKILFTLQWAEPIENQTSQ